MGGFARNARLFFLLMRSHPPLLAALFTFCRTILRDIKLRRQWLGGLTALLVGSFFLGAVPAAGWLEQHPWIFLCFWLAIAWLLLTVILLALLDLLLVQAAGRAAEKKLARDLQQKKVSSSAPTEPTEPEEKP
jgi:hypothetical protein